LEDSDVDANIILRWIFRKWNVRAWTGPIWVMLRTDGRYL
jgi:hypothetical protein